MLGGVLISHLQATAPQLSFRSAPEDWKCESLDLHIFQRSVMMIFAIEEINKDPNLLPNITLGYRIYENCMNVEVALRAAMTLIAGLDDVITDYNCTGVPPVVAIVGDPLSIHSIAISRLLGLFRMPLISYCATCACLSDKVEFPSFFRTIPSDTFQVKAIVQILKHYNWTWVGIVGIDDDYGFYAIDSLNKEVKKFGCVSFSETFKVTDSAKLTDIAKVIKQSTATVIVAFLIKAAATVFVNEIAKHNITGKQWIASDSWSAFPMFASNEKFSIFGGTLGIAVRRGDIPNLDKFLLSTHPTSDPENNLINKLWEELFECRFPTNSTSSDLSGIKMCTGSEDIASTKTDYTDVTDLRTSYNVYKAVYSLAHSLHNLMTCEDGKGPFKNNTCADIKSVQPWQLFHYLKKVDFIDCLGKRFTYDKNGDAIPAYDIINWQRLEDGTMISKTIGVFDESPASGYQLSFREEDIFWNFVSRKVPDSVCSASCPAGTRKATRKGEPICCFDCVPCAEGEISSKIDSTECIQCPLDFWSNHERTQCVVKEIEYLSYDDAMGGTLTMTALLGACLSICVFAVFMHYRNTPVVKANNSELSFLLLVSLTLCFLCSLCFIGQPSNVTCMLRHVMFGISFVLSISCILVKTIVVIMAFKATLPGNNMMKWFGVSQQRGTVFFFTFIQCLICIIWLVTTPPTPAKNSKYQNAKIISECDLGSLTGFSCLLGYIGFLAFISFFLAFLARNLPDTFNEAKFITFSMLIFCAVWITFIPAYISSPGKYTVAVEIFAILASSFGLLFAIFAPKCYIILLRPEQNTKKALMGR
ncbi:extracellular calcium-sensing receptor-like isoform X1 [Erpetoichthys calabaricus]|uniref:extracellular calcium-sensing receptor-like isoform X1 n=1 Tax=Erpetoichthys calabaricus TaxID=27687 RepID=UPI002233E3E9|nr:extracellular calcium-sensing receptor-like isoform X1 [Erpetoichthys calabaricus]